jgi:hypothetical protein
MTLESLLSKVAKEFCFGRQEWWLEKIKSFPKNEWFSPNNAGEDNDFSVCMDAHHFGWCDMIREPVWKNDSYTGVKVSFRFNVE